MANQTPSDLFSERRRADRIPFRSSVRFHVDPRRPLRLGTAVAQDLSINGLRILSPKVLENKRSFDVWLPVNQEDVVEAKATVAWMKIESELGDSPYWVHAGLSLSFGKKEDLEIFSRFLSQRGQFDPATVNDISHRIGFLV